MRRLALVALLVSLSAPVFAHEHADSKIVVAGLAAMMAAEGADLSTTMYAIGQGNAREANPVFAPFVKYPAVAGAFKIGLSAGVAYVLLRVHAEHPKIAALASWSIAGVLTSVAIHNAQLGRSTR